MCGVYKKIFLTLPKQTVLEKLINDQSFLLVMDGRGDAAWNDVINHNPKWRENIQKFYFKSKHIGLRN